jgi:hypothetical protein
LSKRQNASEQKEKQSFSNHETTSMPKRIRRAQFLFRSSHIGMPRAKASTLGNAFARVHERLGMPRGNAFTRIHERLGMPRGNALGPVPRRARKEAFPAEHEKRRL